MKFIQYQYPTVYRPFSRNNNLRDQIDRLFDAALPALSSFQRERFFDDQVDFPIEVLPEKDALVVRAELPGFRKEELTVEVVDDVLTVTGHQKAETKGTEVETKTTTRERRVSRSFTLPENLQLEKIEAAYENGILTVRLPKAEPAKPHQVEIKG